MVTVMGVYVAHELLEHVKVEGFHVHIVVLFVIIATPILIVLVVIIRGRLCQRLCCCVGYLCRWRAMVRRYRDRGQAYASVRSVS